MLRYFVLFFCSCTLLLTFSCTQEKVNDETPKSEIAMESDFESPPAAAVKASEFQEHGYTRIDNYYWLKEKENPEVINYLEAENSYAETVLASTKDLQNKIFEELKGRIKEEDTSVPTLRNGYYYYSRTEEGKQYSIYCRKKGSLEAEEEILIDGNKMIEGHDAFIFGGYSISPDNKIMAYAFNHNGSYVEYTIKFKNLETGEDYPDVIEAGSNFEWANDNQTLFYGMYNEALRPFQIYRHKLEASGKDALVYEEKDDKFNLGIYKSKTDDYLFLYSGSFTTTEIQYLPADHPDGQFQVFAPREKDVEYSVSHHKDKFIIRYKDPDHKNSKIMEAPLTGFSDKSSWKEVVAHDPEVLIQNVDVFADFLVYSVRTNGLEEIRYMNFKDGSQESVSFPEPVYTIGYRGAPEYDSKKVRYAYWSLNRPQTTYEYDLSTADATILKVQEIPSGFNPDDYVVERTWATAKDGVKVPMAVLYKKGLQKDGNNPSHLYSYGSYGSSTDPYFRSSVFSLVDRGFVYAIAQIRGGSELGEEWYEQGKLLNKKNTFTDFIACAEHLVKEKYTNPDMLTASGGSAGGLLMGAVSNMRPDLFEVIVSRVPFVDVINTMLDESLPLTTQEWEQWGNPNEKEYYDYIMSYSPYDNIEAKDYPHMLVTAGLNDSQVRYHEPAKYVAKMRELKTDDNIVVLKTNMESGHGGASGRFDRLKETAFSYAFILDRLGLKDVENKEI